MSLPIPLTVRLSSTYGSWDITNDMQDLSFRWADPGGYSSCSVTLIRPLATQPAEVDYYHNLTVHDARNGHVVWDGRLEDPGRSAGQQGEMWNLSAIGGQANLRDVVKPRLYVDQTMEFRRVSNDSTAASDSVTEDPGGAVGPDGAKKDALVLQFNKDAVVVANTTKVQVRWDRATRCDEDIARISYSYDMGVTDAAYVLDVMAGQAPGDPGSVTATHAFTTSGGSNSLNLATTVAANQRDTIDFRMRRTAAHTVPSDSYWLSIKDLIVVGMRYTRDNQPITSGYNDYVVAHEVVDDLVASLPGLVADTRSIDTTASTQIKQLAYMDGADAVQVLGDLMTLEGGYTYRVWERETALTTMNRSDSGDFRLDWKAIPTSVSYEADTIDGYDSEASGDGLYNEVTVRWTDPTGRIRTRWMSSEVPALTRAGIVRRGWLDLGDEVGTYEAADRAGQQWLADRSAAANGGRLRIARPIRDLSNGRMIMPWEIRPGLIRVRGILPRQDALNAESRDGVTIFRIVGCEFSANDGVATLELDSYPNSLSQTIARLRELASQPSRRRQWLNRPGRR